jgi:hypothetical protein
MASTVFEAREAMAERALHSPDFSCSVNIVGPYRSPWLIFGWQRGNASPRNLGIGPERDPQCAQSARLSGRRESGGLPTSSSGLASPSRA